MHRTGISPAARAHTWPDACMGIFSPDLCGLAAPFLILRQSANTAIQTKSFPRPKPFSWDAMLSTTARQASRTQAAVHARWRPKWLEANVNEFLELADWFAWRGPRDFVVVDRLSNPAVREKKGQYVSVITNNFLGIAKSPRLRTAAHRG